MSDCLERVSTIWRRTFAISWPISIQETLTTLMRTVDIVVTGFFSPAAVTAVGLADLYAQIPMRVGQGLGTGAIALSSQDTGRGSLTTRNNAITQAVVIGFIAGFPLVLVGLLFADTLIEILGAEREVVQLAGIYLTILFIVAPMRIVGLVGARAFQGTGDTRTPMIVNGTVNVINILGTVGLGLGVGPLPRMGILGVGVATAASRTIEALLVLATIHSDWTELSFARPQDITITKQLIAVSIPNFAEGMSSAMANFPFNALLLTFGTEVNAGYHVGRRIYQQFTGPLYRSYSVAASIIVGQTLGEGKPASARFSGLAITLLSIITLGLAGIGLFAGAEPLAQIFTTETETLGHAVSFTRVFGISVFFMGILFPLTGSLRGAGDTKTPFYARFTGTFGFMLGFAYVTGVVLDYGLIGVYAGIVLSYVWWALIVAIGFLWGDWANRAQEMMSERVLSTD